MEKLLNRNAGVILRSIEDMKTQAAFRPPADDEERKKRNKELEEEKRKIEEEEKEADKRKN
ncbi:MAG TPA: hypothetical protein VKP65_20050 [Rhodothermales bacterium]|nr:hypothetical protein [Rhodothermales bacterium]